MRNTWPSAGLLIGVLMVGACDQSVQRDVSDSASQAGSHSHEHAAPHGGTLVVLGEEMFHLELVHDPRAGRLTLYVLDGHLETFIRLPVPGIETSITLGTTNRSLVLTAVAQSATGESVGDSSQFAGAADWLKAVAELDGVITRIDVRGRQFSNIAFRVAAGEPAITHRKQ